MSKETINTSNAEDQKNFTFSDDPYVFDMDKNDFPALTENNVKRINFIIHQDSNYRFLDDCSTDAISVFINQYGRTTKKSEIVDIIKYIDKRNSTHQSSEGPKGGNKGCEKTAEYILSIEDFYGKLENGEAELVNDIAKNAIYGRRYTFSFASKYCTYMARALFAGMKEEDNYCIYDKIISDILPYYAWVYLGKNYKGRKRSTIQSTFAKKNKGDYGAYRNLIDDIRYCPKRYLNSDYVISRKDFDHLLWYYFKGGSQGANSRITRAMTFVGDENSRLR